MSQGRLPYILWNTWLSQQQLTVDFLKHARGQRGNCFPTSLQVYDGPAVKPSGHTCDTQGGYLMVLAPYHGSYDKSQFKSPLGCSENAPFQHGGGQRFVFQFFKKTVLSLAQLVPPRRVPPPPSSHTYLRPLKQAHTVSTGTWCRSKSHNLISYYVQSAMDFRWQSNFLLSIISPLCLNLELHIKSIAPLETPMDKEQLPWAILTANKTRKNKKKTKKQNPTSTKRSLLMFQAIQI